MGEKVIPIYITSLSASYIINNPLTSVSFLSCENSLFSSITMSFFTAPKWVISCCTDISCKIVLFTCKQYKLNFQHIKIIQYYENQEWPWVLDRKISVEGDMLWDNPNRGVSPGFGSMFPKTDIFRSGTRGHSWFFFLLNIDNKMHLLAFLLFFDA